MSKRQRWKKWKQKLSSRKNFLKLGAALVASASLVKIFSFYRSKKNETIKMLTQDGKLVEIKKDLIASNGKKISNEELQQFIIK